MKWIGIQTVYDHVRLNKGITLDSVSITTIQSSGESFVDNDTSLMTSAAIDDRINTAVTAEDLDLTADSGTAAVDLNSQALAVTGGTNATTSATGQAVTINVDDAFLINSGNDTTTGVITSAGLNTGYLIADGDRSVTPGDGAMIHVDAGSITDSSTSGSGTATKYTHVNIESPRLLATNSSVTTTDAATLYISDAPTAHTNQTITNAYALWVDAGDARFDGAVAVTGALTGTLATVSQPNITTLAGLTSFGAAGATTDIAAGDLTMYNAVNNGNPTISLGSSATERLKIESIYESGAQGLDSVRFTTYTAGSSANDGRMAFYIDEVNTFQIKDSAANIMANGKLTIGNIDILTDSSGTTTLNNIDALDTTTRATIDAATKQLTHHEFTDDMGTTKQYIGLLEADAENTNTANKYLPFPAITAGKLLKVALRSNKNLTGHTITWRLESIGAANPNSATPDILGTQSGAGCNNTTMTTYDFTTSLDSGTNVFDASDLVFLSIQSDTDFGNAVVYYITCVWEWDLS